MISLKEDFQKLIQLSDDYVANAYSAQVYFQMQSLSESIGDKIAEYIEELLQKQFPDNDLWQFIHQTKLVNKIDILKLKQNNDKNLSELTEPKEHGLHFSLVFYTNRKERKPPQFEIDWFFYDNGQRKSVITYSANKPSVQAILWARTLDTFVKENFSVI